MWIGCCGLEGDLDLALDHLIEWTPRSVLVIEKVGEDSACGIVGGGEVILEGVVMGWGGIKRITHSAGVFRCAARVCLGKIQTLHGSPGRHSLVKRVVTDMSEPARQEL